MDSEFLARWGVVSMDWSNARAEWAQGKPMDCDGRLMDQVRAIKSASENETKVFVYRK